MPAGGRPTGGCPCKVVLAVADRPLTGGLGRSRPSHGRSYIPVFQIRMEKMKEVKRPPLEQYPHDGSLQQDSFNMILQLLLRGREENRRWWLKL
ncbi:hypothetical protein B296_00004767 [Ensete ventricosum]|uniref:Uncharacterized protein n=1 Tax=Ensete ventricosum TaxID=4639 RepID=A0A427ASL7_ENSVE|nr:hypothetical protein B296_00004767 [Ensete ventricosum]